MSLIITPGQLSRRAELYYQISQLTAAGIGLVQAIEQLERNPPSRSYRLPLQRMLANLQQGATFSDALRASSGWLPDFDIALIEAGERSGRIDNCMRVLSDYYHARARLTKQMLSQLMYPVGLIHFAALVFGVIVPWAGSSFNASLPWLLLKTGIWLLPLYLGAALLIYSLQSKHGERWRSFVESALGWIPLLGSARRALTMARLSLALEALINAGVNIIEAWSLAVHATGSPALKRLINTWKAPLEEGHTPAELVRESRVFPDVFANFYASGEVSGKLDESLRRLHGYYQDEGTRKLQMLADLTPKIIYLIVALCIAYQIIKFYSGYFSQISSITQGF